MHTRSEQRAGAEPHKVDGEGHGECLVKVVDAPHPAPLGVAPRAVVFHVQVAHCQNCAAQKHAPRKDLFPNTRAK